MNIIDRAGKIIPMIALCLINQLGVADNGIDSKRMTVVDASPQNEENAQATPDPLEEYQRYEQKEEPQKKEEISQKDHAPGKNPTRQQVFEALGNDVIRALAWQESKWKQFNKHGKPVTGPAKSVGIMQINPAAWKDHFEKDGNDPPGYIPCTMEEASNNWRTNIHNGLYIFETYIPTMFTDEQKQWPETAEGLNTPNQLDLAIYAYRHQLEDVRNVTSENWNQKVAKNKYVRAVHKHMKTKPWRTTGQIAYP